MAVFSFLPKTLFLTIAIIITIILTLLFFFLHSPRLPRPNAARRSLLESSDNGGPAIFETLAPSLSIPILTGLIGLHFYALIKTAQDHFSVVTTRLSALLGLSPSMAAVTLLALGNGAPDVFASLAALRAGHHRTGLAAILSAGAFVSAFVVGFVAIHAAPFPLPAATFVRDVSFYLVAALFLFYVYLSAEIYLWQAVAFVLFYFFFVGLVFYMDLGMVVEAAGDDRRKDCSDSTMAVRDCEAGKDLEAEKAAGFGFHRVLGMVCSGLMM